MLLIGLVFFLLDCGSSGHSSVICDTGSNESRTSPIFTYASERASEVILDGSWTMHRSIPALWSSAEYPCAHVKYWHDQLALERVSDYYRSSLPVCCWHSLHCTSSASMTSDRFSTCGAVRTEDSELSNSCTSSSDYTCSTRYIFGLLEILLYVALLAVR